MNCPKCGNSILREKDRGKGWFVLGCVICGKEFYIERNPVTTIRRQATMPDRPYQDASAIY